MSEDHNKLEDRWVVIKERARLVPLPPVPPSPANETPKAPKVSESRRVEFLDAEGKVRDTTFSPSLPILYTPSSIEALMNAKDGTVMELLRKPYRAQCVVHEDGSVTEHSKHGTKTLSASKAEGRYYSEEEAAALAGKVVRRGKDGWATPELKYKSDQGWVVG